MNLEILLIRHGESEADILGVHEGRADFDLTQKGVVQAKRLAKVVRETYPPSIIWSSPLKRASEVAKIISSATGAPIRLHNDLQEWNNGVLAGLSREEAQRRYPLPPEGRAPHERIEGGESALEFRYRVESVFSQIVYESNAYNRIAVVSHGGTLSQLLQVFLKLPFNEELRFVTSDTGFHLLVIDGEKRTVRFLNNTQHLTE